VVIGDGMVARSFLHYQDSDRVLIFASGVSNSKLAVTGEFEREKSLFDQVLKTNPGRKIIYFSTFNLYDPKECNSPYCLHKLDMEDYISSKVPVYNVFRLGHVVGRSYNSYTILSYLYKAIKEGIPFDLWKHAGRNLIDIDDVSKICSYIIDNNLFNNNITDVCNIRNTSVQEIVNILEELLGKKGVYRIIDQGGNPVFTINNEMQRIALDLGILFNESYARRVIYKYYVARES
jgi:UDP-2-acetamido-2,6-beta-L-arabino-hexul-4-ose reductase